MSHPQPETVQPKWEPRTAPEQKASDFIGTVKTSEADIPVKQTIPVPKKR